MHPRILSLFASLLFVTGLSIHGVAATRYVSPNAVPGGDGSLARPWTLMYALLAPEEVHPGDTVWVRGGTYVGHFGCFLNGTAEAPIIIRAFPGERATLAVAADDPNVTLFVGSRHVWFWGLEFTSTNVETLTTNASAVYVRGAFNRFIHCVFHDATGNGIGDEEGVGTQIIGCLSYFNGRKTNDDAYAYGVYGQNNGAHKTYSDNFFLNNFGNYQLHMYSENERVDSFMIRHNVVASTVSASTLMFSAAPGPVDIVIDSNYFFGATLAAPLWTERKALVRPIIRGNQFMRGIMSFRNTTVDRFFQGNTIYGGLPIVTSSGGTPQIFDHTTLPQNTWLVSSGVPPRPSSGRVIVRQSPYEPGRANIVVYNWEQRDAVDVDVAGVMQPGMSFVVRDAQNFYGPPVRTGVYDGSLLRLPMTGLPAARPYTQPSRLPAPTHTTREFGTFVVIANPTAPLPQRPPLTQDWTNPALIQMDDDWTGVPGIIGYRGDGLIVTPAVDPQTVTSPGNLTPVDVWANQSSPGSLQVGGLAEFDAIPSPTVGMQASSAAGAPHLLLSFSTLGERNIRVRYLLRDLDGSPDDAVTPVALQYRIGGGGDFINVPAAFIPDATSGPNEATMTSQVDIVLPDAADNQPLVEVRILTTVAVGQNEWVGVDDIVVAGDSLPVQLGSFTATPLPDGRADLHWTTLSETNNFGFQVQWRPGDNGAYADIPGAFRPGYGTTTEPHEYSYRDTTRRVGVRWYRLKQIDLDGTEHFHDGIRVDTPTSVDDEWPRWFALEQNYPNPFNPETRLRFSVPYATRVEAVVCDLAGRRVTTLVDGEVVAGVHEMRWNASGQASGVYLVVFRADGFVASRKILLMK